METNNMASPAPPRRWEVDYFFHIPAAPSPIDEDVYESLGRNERSRRPLRHLADCIVQDVDTKRFIELLEEEEDNHCDLDIIDGPVTKGLRLLHFAVFQHNEDVLSYLLDRGADPNLMDDAGYTPIHLCAEKGYSNLIPMLLRYGARLRFTELNPGDHAFGDPPRATLADEPLRLAIKNREHETALFFLEHGANPNATYYVGQEINLVDPTDLVSLEMLLDFGADPNSRDIHGLTPLMKACRHAEATEAVYLLISHGADVNAMTDSEKRFPLHYAVLTGNLELVQILVNNGAIVRFPPNYSQPPPHYFAVMKGNVRILTYLVDHGADVNSAYRVVGSALHVALTEKIPNKYQVVQTLLERGANPNAITVSSNGPVLKTPIGEYIHSCEQPDLKLVKLLLKYGARILLHCQRDHPLGIIKVIHRLHLGLIPEVMDIIIEACEEFNVPFIINSRQMSDEHKQLLLDRAQQPFPLTHIARIGVRRSLGWGPSFIEAVNSFDIPSSLKQYIFFEHF